MSEQAIRMDEHLAPVIDITITHFPKTEEDGEHYEVHLLHADGTRSSVGTTRTYEAARNMRAKRELGIPNAIKTWWTDVEIKELHPIP